MPCLTQNSQAMLRVEAHSDGNLPCLPGDNSVPVSSTSPPGASNLSFATNLSSQQSPEFLATVVHAVKAALVAEQAFVPGPAPPSLPVQGASSIMNSSTVATFGGVPSLLSSQATAFAASGSGFSAPSTLAGASAAQGRSAFVVPTFVSTFLPPTPSQSLSIANMVPLLPQDSISSTLPLHQASLSSATSFPILNQPFIVGPGFTPVPAKKVGQVVVGKFVDLGDLLPSSVVSAEPEPQLLFDGHLVLTSTSKKPKRCVEDITTWMEAFQSTSLTSHPSSHTAQKTYCNINCSS